jgi:hypothetical protein
MSYIDNNIYKKLWLSKCNCSSQKHLITTGIWTRDFWFRCQNLRPLDQPAVKCVSVNIVHINTYIHTTHALSLKGEQRHHRYFSEKPTFYQNYLAMMNTVNRQVVSPSPSDRSLSAVNPLVAFYDIHGTKREVLFFYIVPDTTRDTLHYFINIGKNSEDRLCFILCYEYGTFYVAKRVTIVQQTELN